MSEMFTYTEGEEGQREARREQKQMAQQLCSGTGPILNRFFV